MAQPSSRRASTRSPIGRSCMRGTPLSVKSPPCTASAAVSGRMAVPALPMKNSMASAGHARPPRPTMVTVVPCTSTPQPSWRNAASITRVSSESSRSCTTVVPSHKAESNNTRFEMLLEPGRVTVPWAPVSGGRSRKGMAYIPELSLILRGRPPLRPKGCARKGALPQRQSGWMLPDPPEQPRCNRQVQQVPGDAIEEGRLVAAGQVENPARHPAAQRHAQQRGHDDRADAGARLVWRKVFADDDGVRGHDAALKQPEH